MMSAKKYGTTAIALVVSIWALTGAQFSMAASADYFGKVIGLMNDQRPVDNRSYFGGCMAKLNPGPDSVVQGCGAEWVTFACDGTIGAKSTNAQAYSTAQLAAVTNDTVQIWLDDTKTIDGKCYANYIMVRPDLN